MIDKDKAILKAKKYMLRKAAGGDPVALEKAKKVFASEKITATEIFAGTLITFADADDSDQEHPNKMPFKGVLLIVDQPSTKPPHGSRGHRIYVPKNVVQKKLDGLIGMGVNYDSVDLDSHDTSHKVGIITAAWVKGNQVWVRGFIYKKDFPKAATDLKRGGLGMSMELANVYVRDENEDVWHLEDFAFTGATILKKNAAAYFQTELVANGERKTAKTALAAAVSGKRKGEGMAEKVKKETNVAAAASQSGQGELLVTALKGALSEVITPLVGEIRASNDRQTQLHNDVEELKGLYMIQAAAHEEEEDEEMSAAHEEDDDEEMSAAKDNKQDDNDDDEGEEDDLDAMEDLEKEAVEEDPGDVNEDAKNKGDKTTVTNPPNQREKVSGNIAKKRLQSSGVKAKASKRLFPGLKSSASIQAAAMEIATLTSQVQKMKRQNQTVVEQMHAAEQSYRKETKKLKGELEILRAQAEKWSDQVNRRSVIPVEIRNLMAKAQVDPYQLKAEGRKLSVEDVDRMFDIAASQGIQVDTTMRAAYKSRMYQEGLMESGEVPFSGLN